MQYTTQSISSLRAFLITGVERMYVFDIVGSKQIVLAEIYLKLPSCFNL